MQDYLYRIPGIFRKFCLSFPSKRFFFPALFSFCFPTRKGIGQNGKLIRERKPAQLSLSLFSLFLIYPFTLLRGESGVKGIWERWEKVQIVNRQMFHNLFEKRNVSKYWKFTELEGRYGERIIEFSTSRDKNLCIHNSLNVWRFYICWNIASIDVTTR